MSTTFLLNFSEALVATLLHEQEIEITPGQERAVVDFLAEHIHKNRTGSSLISLVATILLECPHVEELYADNQRIKSLVEELKT